MEAILSSEMSGNFYRTRGVTSQPIVHFIVTAVKPSNPKNISFLIVSLFLCMKKQGCYGTHTNEL
jgi:hypothetical protein